MILVPSAHCDHLIMVTLERSFNICAIICILKSFIYHIIIISKCRHKAFKAHDKINFSHNFAQDCGKNDM